MLRSIRYGEADRVLHLYTATRGRVGAIAKGSRRPRSRFGGRLEPFFRLDLILHEGRGELATVTSASTVAAHPALRSSGPALMAAARGCDAVLRLLTPPRRMHPPTTCYAAIWRCWTARGRRVATGRAMAPLGSLWRLPFASSSLWRQGSRRSSAPARAAVSRKGWWASRARPAAWSVPPASGGPSSSPATRTGSWSRRWAARWPWRRAPRSAPCARSSVPSRRRSSITPTCGFEPPPRTWDGRGAPSP